MIYRRTDLHLLLLLGGVSFGLLQVILRRHRLQTLIIRNFSYLFKQLLNERYRLAKGNPIHHLFQCHSDVVYETVESVQLGGKLFAIGFQRGRRLEHICMCIRPEFII